jgi:3-deoxy-D-manno-octulosonic-acid transferase
MTNFREIIRTLTEYEAVRKVETPNQLVHVTVELLQDEIQRAELIDAARLWTAANRGATERTLAVIRELLRN